MIEKRRFRVIGGYILLSKEELAQIVKLFTGALVEDCKIAVKLGVEWKYMKNYFNSLKGYILSPSTWRIFCRYGTEKYCQLDKRNKNYVTVTENQMSFRGLFTKEIFSGYYG